MQNSRYCVIMAGGVGSRFWPVSRNNHPKQFLDILGTGKSFIRHTFERFLPLIPPENFMVVTNVRYRDMVLEHLPELTPEQVLCEPLGRNTAPCIAYAAHKLWGRDPGSSMVVTPADHMVLNEGEFVKAISEGLEFAESHPALVTIGIKPSRPDTGYGYIQIDTHEKSGNLDRVKTFTEKPTAEVAQAFVDSGEFFWNSGIFIWKTSQIIGELKQHLPELDGLFSSIAGSYYTAGEQEAIERVYPECRNVSIDYGIMERASNVYVRCSEFGWSDIGTWGSLYNLSPKDPYGNAVMGRSLVYDTEGCIINMPEGKIAVVQGMKDLIIVDSGDALLICRRDDEQSIRVFVEDVRQKEGPEFV